MQTFEELDDVMLIEPLTTPDGVIPIGTGGTVVLVLGEGQAYIVEFDDHNCPETVPAEYLMRELSHD